MPVLYKLCFDDYRYGARPLVLQKVAPPELTPADILIEVEACGFLICTLRTGIGGSLSEL